MGYSYALRIGPDIGGNTNDVPNKPSFHLGVYSVGVVADRYYFDPTPPTPRSSTPIRSGRFVKGIWITKLKGNLWIILGCECCVLVIGRRACASVRQYVKTNSTTALLLCYARH